MILAHGLGGRSDLPVPLWVALYGGGMAVILSFALVVAFWPRPRFDRADPGVPLPGIVQRLSTAPAVRHLLAAAGLVGLALTLAVALLGAPDAGRNPAPTWMYVWFWVGLVPASLLLGPVWRSLNPLRSLAAAVARLSGTPWAGDRHHAYPERWGHWPAVAGLAVFLWLELVYANASDPRVVAMFLVGYTFVHVTFGARFGPAWFERADAFEVYSTLIGRLSPWGRRDDGRLVLRDPFSGLAGTPGRPGLVTVVCLLLGSTLFDGLTRTRWWSELTDGTQGLANALWGTAGLGLSAAAVLALYLLATGMTGDARPQPLPRLFAHSLVPIAVGYTVAHYFSFLVFQGQAGYLLASDPFARGWDLFGTADGRIDYLLVTPDVIAVVQIAAIVTGHVIGVVAAHDRALSVFPGKGGRRRQYPLLAAMVTFTLTGITLLTGAGA